MRCQYQDCENNSIISIFIEVKYINYNVTQNIKSFCQNHYSFMQKNFKLNENGVYDHKYDTGMMIRYYHVPENMTIEKAMKYKILW